MVSNMNSWYLQFSQKHVSMKYAFVGQKYIFLLTSYAYHFFNNLQLNVCRDLICIFCPFLILWIHVYEYLMVFDMNNWYLQFSQKHISMKSAFVSQKYIFRLTSYAYHFFNNLQLNFSSYKLLDSTHCSLSL